jgi:hypothetical protein
MTMKFVEAGRIPCTDHTELVVSKVSDTRGYIGIMLKKYITSDSYTGWGKEKGFLVPKEQLKNLLAVLKC